MPSVPAFVRNRFRRIAPGATGLRLPSGPGIAVLMEGEAAGTSLGRVLRVVAGESDIHAIAANLVDGHLKAHPEANVYAQAAIIPNRADRERTLRELGALCGQ